MIDELIPWLRAQLDALAERAPFIHHANCEYFHHTWSHEESLEHCTCQESARVLAEVDAKRRILDWLEDDAGFDLPATKTQAMSRDEWNRVFTARTTIKMLALPYADRPGYREEWKP